MAARVLGVAALALLLAGCFRVDMDVEVSPEDTVSGTAVIAVDESLVELSGQSADEIFSDVDSSDLPEGASFDDYSEDGFVGQQITFEDVPLEEFTSSDTLSGSGLGEELSIVREGDEFVVTGALDMSGEQFTGTDIPQQFLENFEFTISITFPGEVTQSTGEVDGNTVTWEPKVGENTPIEARASAIPSASSPWLIIALVALGAFLLGAVVFLLTRRRAAVPAGPVDGDAVPPPAAEGPIEESAVPPAAAPAPTAPLPPEGPTAPAAPPAPPGSALPPEDEPPASR
ncbi:MAG TPA: hypothetical protein VFZ75_02520 [Actinomycetota bacterium]|nr:hypothetical protein [Actinomycetota bacterium]